VCGLLLDACEKYKHEPFIVQWDGKTVNYGEFLVAVHGVVRELDHLGLRKGDSLVCYVEETVPLIHIICACALTGVVFVPISPTFTLKYLENLVEKLGARYVFTRPNLVSTLRSSGFHTLYLSEQPIGKSKMGWLGRPQPVTYDQAMDHFRSRELPQTEDVFMIQPTSGSTGEPKLVLRAHGSPIRYARYVGAQIERSSQSHQSRQQERFLCTAALTHALGCHMLTTALALGASLAIPSQIDTAADLREILKLDPTVLPTTPRVLRSLCRQHVALTGDIEIQSRVFGPSAKLLLSAGSSGDVKLMNKIALHNVQIVEFYGSSETSLISLTPVGQWREGFAGRVLPDVDVRVDADGEILVRSHGQMQGYLGDEELTKSAYTADGYYKTGDLGQIDEEGYLRILGRKRDVFNTPEGSNIYPERIEQALESIAGIKQAILVGDQQPELTALIVVESNPSETELQELHAAISEQIIRINMRLEKVERVSKFIMLTNEFPSNVYDRTHTGKIRRTRKAVQTTFGKLLGHALSVAKFVRRMNYSRFHSEDWSVMDLISAGILPDRRLDIDSATNEGRRAGDPADRRQFPIDKAG
jgi:long-chain acyl-CoA synthetase